MVYNLITALSLNYKEKINFFNQVDILISFILKNFFIKNQYLVKLFPKVSI